MTANTDAPNLLTRDLWVDPDKWEIWTKDRGVELADDDASAESEDTEESGYEDSGSEDSGSEYEEDEYEFVSEDGIENGEFE